MKRSLSLAREALSELSTDELLVVNGAAVGAPRTLNVQECVTGPLTQHTALDCLTRFGC